MKIKFIIRKFNIQAATELEIIKSSRLASSFDTEESIFQKLSTTDFLPVLSSTAIA